MRLWTLHPEYLDARGLVALWREALLAQATRFGRETLMFALVLFAVCLFIGVATFVRSVAINFEDARWVAGMNLLRHAYLEIVLCALGAVLDPAIPAERTLYLRAARALVLIVFFWSGVQKLVNGYWTNGLYLAFALRTPSYRAVLWPLVPAVELDRLASLGIEVGSGPYTPAAPTLVAVSNATWMFGSRSRLAGVETHACRRGPRRAIALVAAIQVGAREVFFGLVFLDGLLLFLPPRSNAGRSWASRSCWRCSRASGSASFRRPPSTDGGVEEPDRAPGSRRHRGVAARPYRPRAALRREPVEARRLGHVRDAAVRSARHGDLRPRRRDGRCRAAHHPLGRRARRRGRLPGTVSVAAGPGRRRDLTDVVLMAIPHGIG
jgi:hypothetical protein